jgi:cytochrome P450
MTGSNKPRRVRTLAGDPAWQVTGYETVKELLADPRLGRSHPDPENAPRYSDAVIFGQASQATTPEQERFEHKMMRQLLSRSFSARRLAHLKPRIQTMVDELLDRVEQAPQPVDLHEALSFPLPALVICELLGVPYADRDDFRRWSDDSADMTDAARSEAGLAQLKAYMGGLLDRKRAEPAEDVLSDLLAAQAYAGGAFTDNHVVDLAAGLLFAGHETTVAAIDRGIVLFLTHPDQLDRLRQDPSLAPNAVEEILRLPNPVQTAAPPPEDAGDDDRASGLPRYTNTSVELNGTTIAAGEMVLLDLGGSNLDTATFPAPQRFDLTRETNPHLTFGHGPHFCIGAPLARIELTAVFATLFTRFPNLRLAIPAEQLQTRSHLLTGGLTAIPATW